MYVWDRAIVRRHRLLWHAHPLLVLSLLVVGCAGRSHGLENRREPSAVFQGAASDAAEAHAFTPPSDADVRVYAQLVEQLADPSMDGRGPGTPGLDKARDLLVSAFQRLGLLGAFQSHEHRRFTQTLEIRLGVDVAFYHRQRGVGPHRQGEADGLRLL